GAVALVLVHAWGGGARDWVSLAQGELMAAGLAAGLWLAGGRRLYGAARPGPELAPLLGLQLGLLLLGNAALLGVPAFLLIAQPGTAPGGVAEVGGAGG